MKRALPPCMMLAAAPLAGELPITNASTMAPMIAKIARCISASHLETSILSGTGGLACGAEVRREGLV